MLPADRSVALLRRRKPHKEPRRPAQAPPALAEILRWEWRHRCRPMSQLWQAPPMARHRRRLRLSRAKERMIPMQIGCFRADGAGFVGRVSTLTLDVPVMLLYTGFAAYRIATHERVLVVMTKITPPN